MNGSILALAGVGITACAVGTRKAQPKGTERLPDLGPAPDLATSIWLNTPDALRLGDLRGRVVLIEFWTFGCINCQRVVPALGEWHQRYGAGGLVVIGSHYPEFGYEADLENLRNAVARLEISYPIVQDNRGENWKAYRNRFWPTLVLIDRRGRIRHPHIGEGDYAETEAAIQSLLHEPPTPTGNDSPAGG